MYYMRFLILFLTLFVIGCASNNSDKVIPTNPEELYSSGVKNISEKRFAEAIKDFSTIEKEHPAHRLAPNATMLKMYAYFKSDKFDDATFAADDFVRNYPANQHVDYVYYIRALSLINQMMDFERDQSLTEDSLLALNKLITRFPHSKYSADAKKKRQFAYDTIAAKEMSVGRFYLFQKMPFSAVLRFQNVIRIYPKTAFRSEALYRMVEVYTSIGILDEAKYYAEVLSKEFPDSKWSKRGQALVSRSAFDTNDDATTKNLME